MLLLADHRPQIRPMMIPVNLVDERRAQSNEVREEEEEECRTPTSKAHQIPAISSCPPPPKKPKWVVLNKKRKLPESQFFQVDHTTLDGLFSLRPVKSKPKKLKLSSQ